MAISTKPKTYSNHSSSPNKNYTSLKNTFRALFELTRPINCIFAALSTILGYIFIIAISTSKNLSFPSTSAFLSSTLLRNPLLLGNYILFSIPAALSVFLICAGGQVINDYFDRGIDAKINPTRPIPSGRISATTAHLFAVLLFTAGTATAATIHIIALWLAAFFSILLYAYSGLFYKRKYFGNVLVAFSSAFTFIYGGIATYGTLYAYYSENITVLSFLMPAIIVSSALFFSSWARELTKDLNDFAKGEVSKKTLPAATSISTTRGLVVFFILLAIGIGLYIWRYFGIFYLLFLAMGIYLFAESISTIYKARYYKAKQLQLKAMGIILLGFLAGMF